MHSIWLKYISLLKYCSHNLMFGTSMKQVLTMNLMQSDDSFFPHYFICTVNDWKLLQMVCFWMKWQEQSTFIVLLHLNIIVTICVTTRKWNVIKIKQNCSFTVVISIRLLFYWRQTNCECVYLVMLIWLFSPVTLTLNWRPWCINFT